MVMVQKHQDVRLLSMVAPEIDKLAQNVLAPVTRRLRPAGRRDGDNAGADDEGDDLTAGIQVAGPFLIGTEMTVSEYVLCPSTPLVAVEVGGSILDSKRILMCLEYHLQRTSGYARPPEVCSRWAVTCDLYLLTHAFIAVTKSAAFPPQSICRGADERAILAQIKAHMLANGGRA
eukprot:1731232-Amphidinium_carterae.1